MRLNGDAVHGFGAPVLAVCGFSGSGKTTLLESAIPRLVERGLAVAIVKHDAHGFEVDRPGKDSDRFFRAGATVTLSGGQQQFERRGVGAMLSLEAVLARLGRDHDLLLVEGHKDTPLPKFWLGSAERLNSPENDAPENVTNIVATLAWNSPRLNTFMELYRSLAAHGVECAATLSRIVDGRHKFAHGFGQADSGLRRTDAGRDCGRCFGWGRERSAECRGAGAGSVARGAEDS